MLFIILSSNVVGQMFISYSSEIVFRKDLTAQTARCLSDT